MTLTTSQADWLRVRSYLQEHRHALTVDAAGDYPDERRMAGTPLLAAPEWQPAGPVPLHDIELDFSHPRGTPPRTPAPLLSAPAGAGTGSAVADKSSSMSCSGTGSAGCHSGAASSGVPAILCSAGYAPAASTARA